MLKKILAAAAATALSLPLSLPLAPAALAWNEVCVKLPFWRAAYVGKFHVVHGFPDEPDGRLPGFYYDSDRGVYSGLPHDFADDFDRQADGRITSAGISAGFHRCVSIRDLPLRTPFLVYVETTFASAYALCATHSSNPKKYYLRQGRPFLKIWFEATGPDGNPRCDYWKESN